MLFSYPNETPTENQLINMSSECPICAEIYNKSTRAMVTCPWEGCNHSCCKSCVRTYLTSTTKDPCCMNCSKPLDMQWIVDNLNRSYFNGDYKTHRATLLLDRTMAQMSEAMPEVERRTEIAAQKEAVKAAQEAARIAAQAAREAAHDLWKLENKETPAEARKFIMGCPRADCRGFLSSQYKCGLCGFYTCKDCLKCKGEHPDEHVCNEDDVATANLIRSSCKPCPNCGERISKIEGCDQMWCTSCKTAFSWRTGRVDTGVVHNPHFYQFHRAIQNGDEAALNRGRGMNQCNTDQVPGWYLIRSMAQRIRAYCTQQGTAWRPLCDKINDMYRMIAHITHHEIPTLQRRIDSCTDTMTLRVDYLQEKLSKEALSKKLISNDRRRKRDVQIMEVWQLIKTTGLEACWGIVNHNETDMAAFIAACEDELEKWTGLIVYCGQAWLNVALEHKCSVPFIARDGGSWKVKKYHVYKCFSKTDLADNEKLAQAVRRLCLN